MSRNSLVWKCLLASVMLVLVCTANVLAFTISGNVTYGGSKTGRIYVKLNNNLGTQGTSMPATGAFSIRGVPAGTYTLQAFMDTRNTGNQHDSDPYTMTGVPVTVATDTTNIAITLNDPAAITNVSAPTGLEVHPSAGGNYVMAAWSTTGTYNTEQAESYTLYWGTSSNVSSSNFSGSKVVPAAGEIKAVMVPISSGTYYFAVSASVTGAPESQVSSVVGPITVAPATGGATVSGTVTVPAVATDVPLYIAVVDETGNAYLDVIAGPVSSPVSFSVAGIADGNYRVHAVLDINKDGIVNIGDLFTMQHNSVPIAVSGGSNVSNVAVTLTQQNAQAAIRTEHGKDGTSEWYGLNIEVSGIQKRPVAVALTGGPNLSSIPIDYGITNSGNFWGFTGAFQTTPVVGDTYSFDVTYSDGTSEVITGQVTGVMSSFAIPVTPKLNTTFSATPTFNWNAPNPLPSGAYTYFLTLRTVSSGYSGVFWDSSQLPSTQLSAQYNFDGKAGQPTLVDGLAYTWSIMTQDVLGNYSHVTQDFSFPSTWTAYNYSPSKPSDIDWLQSAHPVLGKGEYIYVNGTYYIATGVNGGATGSYWNIPSNMYWGNEFAQCNQTTGMPILTGTTPASFQLADLSFINNTPITGYKTWPGATSAITIVPFNFPSYTANSPFTYQLSAAGGAGSYTWSVSSGSLPNGVTLNPTTGVLSGTPIGAGSYLFIVKATDSASVFAEQFAVLNVSPGGAGGGSYTITGAVQDCSTSTCADLAGVTVTTVGLTPNLTATTDVNGLFTLNIPATTVVNSVPATAPFHLVFSKASFNNSASSQMQYTAAANFSDRPFAMYTSTNLTAWGNTPGTGVIRSRVVDSTNLVSGYITGATVTATTGTGSLTVEYVDPATGSIVATGSTGSNGMYIIRNVPVGTLVTVTASASGYTSFQTRQFNVYADTVSQGRISGVSTSSPVAITTASVPSVQVSTGYNQNLLATGGSGTYSWSIQSGSLPAGINLTTGGLLSGTPTTTGAYTFTLKAADASNASNFASMAYTLNVTTATPLSITTISLPSATISSFYSQTIGATGGSAPYTFTQTSGSLPPGLTLNSSTGTLNGTPTTAGSYTFTVQVTDQAYATALQGYSVIVGGSGAASISGTVSYAGSKSGRIYLTLQSNSGTLGTSIASAGSFTIDGVPSGNYTITAYMDTLGSGTQVLSSPVGTAGVNMSGTAVTGVAITLADPAALTPAAPTNISAAATDSAVLIGWDKARDGNGVEQAESYDIYWGTTAALTKGNATGSKTGVPAGMDSPVILDGLTNGTSLYFMVIPKSGSTEGSASTVYGPVTIGAPTGGSTVSGTVTFNYDGSHSIGPLYVAVVEPQSKGMGKVFMTKTSPFSVVGGRAEVLSLPFTVSGVSNGTYAVYALFDMNNDKMFAVGDVNNTGGDIAPIITVNSANVSGVNIALTSKNAELQLTTDHGKSSSGGSDWYNINGRIRGQLKRPVKVTLTSVPSSSGITIPVDLGIRGGDKETEFWSNVAVRPTVGDTYQFTVTYADATSEVLSGSVSAVVDSFPQTPAISGGTVTTVPTFTWAAPASPPTGYHYSLWVGSNSSNYWDSWFIPSSQLSAIYNADGQATSLTVGNQYSWNIAVMDQYGNRASVNSAFTPTVAGATGGTISGIVTNGSSGLSGIVVTAFDAVSNLQKGVATTVTDGSYSISGLPTGAYKLRFNNSNSSNSFIPMWTGGKLSVALADSVSVTAGSTLSGVNMTLTAGGTISGQVTDGTTGALNVLVSAVNALDEAVSTVVISASNGGYSLKGLPDGNYKVRFYELSSTSMAGYTAQVYTNPNVNSLYLSQGTQIQISSASTVTGINAVLSKGAGSISGVVTDSASGMPVASVSVRAIDLNGGYISAALTDANGNYSIKGIPTGTYKVEFVFGGHVQQWYNALGDYTSATTVSVTAPVATTGINAVLGTGASVYLGTVIKGYGNITTGTTVTKTLQVNNSGTANLVIGTLTISGANFTLLNDRCSGKTIAGGGYCTLQASFSPTALGAATATISIPSNDSDTPVATIALKGTGVSSDVTPPTIVSVTPAVGATNVSIATILTVKFSEDVDPNTLPIESAFLKTAGGVYIPGTGSYDSATRTGTFTPAAPLAYNTTYTGTFSGVKDLVGNTMTSNYTFTFTTGANPDSTAPYVLSSTPKNNATNVAVDGTLSVIFSEQVKAATVSGALVLRAGTTVVSGTTTFDAATNTATFTPAAALAMGTTYSLSVGNAIEDLAGNKLNPVTIFFATEVPSGDIDGLNGVDIADAYKLLEIAVGNATATAQDLKRADVAPLVNGKPKPDGVIDVADVVVILRRVVGLVSW